MRASEDDVVANLRAVVISSKGGLLLNRIRSDYRETFGSDVPFQDLGYRSLEEFFRSKPNNFSISGNTVKAITKDTSAHIASLVSQQRNRKRKPPGKSSFSRRPVNSGFKSFGARTPSVNQSYYNLKKNNVQQTPRFGKREIERKPKDFSNVRAPSIMYDTTKSYKDTPLRQPFTRHKTNEEVSLKGKENEMGKSPIKGTLLEEVTKAVLHNRQRSINGRWKPLEESSPRRLDFSEENTELPFQSVEPYPEEAAFAQSRLRRRKSNLQSDVTCENNNIKNFPSNNENPISPPHKVPDATLITPFKEATTTPATTSPSAPQQKAQSRINNLRSTQMQMKHDWNVESPYEKKLREFCFSKGYETPNYIIHVREAKNEPKSYVCELTVKGFSPVKTYPVETHDEASARDLAAKKAYNILINHPKSELISNEPTYVSKLKNLCISKNLPEPGFNVTSNGKNFICKVVINDKLSFSSHPTEASDGISAQEIVARKAYNIMCSENKYSQKSSKERLVSLVLEILNNSYAIWSDKLPELYKEKYHEELEANWFETFQNSPEFYLEAVQNRTIICKARENPSSKRISVPLSSDPEETSKLPTLKLPETQYWDVYVTYIQSPAEVWCRLIGEEYSDKYDEMTAQLELKYMNNTKQITNPTIDSIYALHIEGIWDRVKLVEICEDKKKGLVFHIDQGEEEMVALTELFHLDASFTKLAPQAFCVSLHELEYFTGVEKANQLLINTLLGNIYVAEVMTLLEKNDRSVGNVVMWDTSTKDDINLNQEVMDKILTDITAPSLARIGQGKGMVVSHVSNSGDIYLQSNKESVLSVNQMVAKLTTVGLTKPTGFSIESLDMKQLYLARNTETGQYSRAKVVELLSKELVNVLFIDHGLTQKTFIKELYLISDLSESLSKVPPQAIRVRLANIPSFHQKMTTRISQILSPEEVVLVKVISTEGQLAYVELFKREQPDDNLLSINKILCQTSNRPESVAGTSQPINLCGSLPPPSLPPVGTYLDVYVTLAANPNLLSIQCLNARSDLSAMMKKLQNICSTDTTITLEELTVGELYAVKNTDNNWYRGCLHALLGATSCSVYLCDYGDFIIVQVEELNFLPKEFRSYPYQALRAKIHGIAPIDGDWAPDDTVYFQELVVDKEFVAQIRDVDNDSNIITLGVILVDTSTEEDVYIHDILLNRKVAKMIS